MAWLNDKLYFVLMLLKNVNIVLFDKRRIDRISEDTRFQGQVRRRPVRHVQLVPWSVLRDKAVKLVIFFKRQRAQKTTIQVHGHHSNPFEVYQVYQNQDGVTASY